VGVLAGTLGLGLAACGSSGPGAASGSSMALWTLQNEGINAVQQAAVDRFNQEHDNVQLKLTTYVNDPYKTKLRTSIGSPNAPDIFYNWGGGNLAEYVEADQVVNLTPALEKHPNVRDAFLPSVLEVGTINGKVYGIPMQGVQPVSFFYNKDVFAKAGIKEFPATWDELLAADDKLKAAGVQPIALAGSQSWTELMYLEYLVDRIGGAEVFQAIVDGDPGAWEHPAVVEAMERVQTLVDRGAFGSNYAAVNYDNNGSMALLSSGKAGMELMGAWEVTGLNDSFPDFVSSGTLGWADFPVIEGGEGNVDNIVGNPSNFYSVSSQSQNPDAATEFLMDQMTSKKYVQGMIDVGQVPAIQGLEDEIKVGKFADFNAFTYEQVRDAPHFTQSWDQALPADISQTMLTNIQQVFNKQMSPRQFAQAMSAAVQ
jgi:raffinose/stachyose/melibiose transport system substrate-binding protein/xylobiose transport system substrate-binding protein